MFDSSQFNREIVKDIQYTNCKRCKKVSLILKQNGLCSGCVDSKQLRELKKKVMERDNFTCQECGKKEGNQLSEELYSKLTEEEKWEVEWIGIEVHHIKPIYLGGTDRIVCNLAFFLMF